MINNSIKKHCIYKLLKIFICFKSRIVGTLYFLVQFHFSYLFLTYGLEINSLHKVHANVSVLQANKCVYIMKKKITMRCTIAKKGSIDIETIPPQGNKRIKY